MSEKNLTKPNTKNEILLISKNFLQRNVNLFRKPSLMKCSIFDARYKQCCLKQLSGC